MHLELSGHFEFQFLVWLYYLLEKSSQDSRGMTQGLRVLGVILENQVQFLAPYQAAHLTHDTGF